MLWASITTGALGGSTSPSDIFAVEWKGEMSFSRVGQGRAVEEMFGRQERYNERRGSARRTWQVQCSQQEVAWKNK